MLLLSSWIWLMDGVKISDVRARDIRIWQINSQNFRVRKIWKTWFLDMRAFSWQNATYTIQFILTIYINSEKLMLPGRCAPVEFFSWKCGKLRKTAKSGYPAVILSFRTELFSALSWNKILRMKLQSLKLLKTTKDMFCKQFEFFANWQGRLWGFLNLVHNDGVQLRSRDLWNLTSVLKVNWDISEGQMQNHHIHFWRDKMTKMCTWQIYLNVFNFRAHVCIRQLWNVKREENDNYRVKLFKHNEKTSACNLIEKYLNISPLLRGQFV